ncbi:MAG: hypothetical protein WBD05_09595 [Phycisphaerae bacterium]
MATDLRASWLGRHFEKVVVLVAAVVFLASLTFCIVRRDSHAAPRTKLGDQIETIKTDEGRGVLTPEDRKELGLDQPLPTAEGFKNRLALLPEMWPGDRDFIPPYRTGEVVVTDRKPAHLPKRILAVEEVQVVTGLGVTTEAVLSPLAEMAAEKLSDIAWVSCVGRFDLDEQFQLNKEGNTEQEKIVITSVEVQRRMRKPDGEWSDWEDVASAIPEAVKSKLPQKPANPRAAKEVFYWRLGLLGIQEQVRRTPFFALVTAAEGQTVYDVAGGVSGVAQPRQVGGIAREAAVGAPGLGAAEGGLATTPVRAPPATVGGWVPEDLEDEDISPPLPPTAQGAPAGGEPPHTYATVWAHDLSVRPGETYQYRMRVSIFNPVYGQGNCEPREDRWVLALEGEWGKPSAEMHVPKLVHFYFVGTFGDRANLELHRWMHGQWVIARSVPCRIGMPIFHQKRRTTLIVPGSQDEVTTTVEFNPGAVLVDLVRDFPYTYTPPPPGKKQTVPTSVLIFADMQGNLGERIEWEDKNAANKDRKAREGLPPQTPTSGQPPRGKGEDTAPWSGT